MTRWSRSQTMIVGGFAAFLWLQLMLIGRSGGPPLVPQVTPVDAGVLPAGRPTEVDLRFENVSGDPVTIIGARSACSCMVASGLPTTIFPGEAGSFPITIVAAADEPSFERSVTLFLDVETDPPVTATIRASVE